MSQEKAKHRAHLMIERSVELNRFRAAYPGSEDRFREIEKLAPDDLKPTIQKVLELYSRSEKDHGAELAQFFGLTAAETKLALHLMQGGSLTEFASLNGTSRNTVRNQLKQVFQKTHVRRQAELVALLRDTQASFR